MHFPLAKMPKIVEHDSSRLRHIFPIIRSINNDDSTRVLRIVAGGFRRINAENFAIY